MKLTTKIIHFLIQTFYLEPLIIFLSKNNHPTIEKLIPLSNSYKAPSIKKVKRDDTLFALDISDYMQWHIWAGLKDISWKLAIKSIKDKSTIFDIGANVGAFCLKSGIYLADNNIKATIIAFEPNPYVFSKLANNLTLNKKLNEKVIIVPKGISDQKGQLHFEWNKNNSGGGKFLLQKATTQENTALIEVVMIDDYIKEKNILNITFIKIDVEGFEPFVIKGALETIKTFRPNMFIEISPEWWKKNGFTVEDVLSPLKELNYIFYPVINENIEKEELLNELFNKKEQFNLFLTQNKR